MVWNSAGSGGTRLISVYLWLFLVLTSDCSQAGLLKSFASINQAAALLSVVCWQKWPHCQNTMASSKDSPIHLACVDEGIHSVFLFSPLSDRKKKKNCLVYGPLMQRLHFFYQQHCLYFMWLDIANRLMFLIIMTLFFNTKQEADLAYVIKIRLPKYIYNLNLTR